jgi:acetate kinase
LPAEPLPAQNIPVIHGDSAPTPAAGDARERRCILTINGGSSSLKFAAYALDAPDTPLLTGRIERIGSPSALFTTTAAGDAEETRSIAAADHLAALTALTGWLDEQGALHAVAAAAHRIVHGGPTYSEPQRITPALLSELRRLSAYAPEHLPAEIALIEELVRQCPDVTQVACFDTAFHRDMPRVARMLAIPRRYDAQGVQRYGFHGLSYAYLTEELARIGGPEAARGRVILAHLGNGASLAAVRDGRSVDTSMGFTPAAGIPMSTRSGDLDPGLIWYLEDTERMTPMQFHHMVNHESGLAGVSETSSDMRDLLDSERTDTRAAEAIMLFCYQTKKWMGAFAAALGGLDTIVFSGGIGEHCPSIRGRICEGLGFLGVEVDAPRNAANAPVISPEHGRVTVRVIRTDEELMMARSVARLLALDAPPRGESTS